MAQYRINEVVLSKNELSQIKRAIADMNIEVFVFPSDKEGFTLASNCRGDLMELFDLISFELNLIEEDIVEI